MKAFKLLVPLFAALVTAGKVDECAGKCISDAIASTGCASSDSICICSSDSFIESVENCGPCSEDGSNAAVALAQNYCETVGHSNLKRSWEWEGHSHNWWQKEWRKLRASWRDHRGHGPKSPKGGTPESYETQPELPKSNDPPAYGSPSPPPSYPTKPKSKHPIEDWFKAHPNYLINHPGWLKKHPNWATKHGEFLKGHLPADSPYWGGNPPQSYPQPGHNDPRPGRPHHGNNPHSPPHGYPQPPPQPHKPYPGKPTTTKPCTTNKPQPTVIDYYN